jgi:hypothetical protein
MKNAVFQRDTKRLRQLGLSMTVQSNLSVIRKCRAREKVVMSFRELLERVFNHGIYNVVALSHISVTQAT